MGSRCAGVDLEVGVLAASVDDDARRSRAATRMPLDRHVLRDDQRRGQRDVCHVGGEHDLVAVGGLGEDLLQRTRTGRVVRCDC